MSTDISVTAAALRTLHRLHRQLADLKERLERGPRVIRAHEANLRRAEEQLAKVRDEAHKFRMATDQKQLDLKASEAAIEKRKRQLNEANDNREYQALLEEIAAAVAAKDVLEIEILEGLEKLDGYQEKIQEAEAVAAKVRQDGEKIQREVQEKEPTIRGDTARAEAELHQCEAALPGEFREAYHRVVRAKGEDALAPVVGEYCGGCNQHVPLNMVNSLMLSRPIFCKSCGRLLYMPEDPAKRGGEDE